jgi:SAM-dependent methyltransferase
MIVSEGPNAEQIRYWDEVAGPTWARLHAGTEAQLAVFGRAAIGKAGISPGDRVLDVGCGAGATSVALGGLVRPTGSVLGVDISGPLLDLARAAAAGLANVSFAHADASTADLPEGGFDLLFSRFGVMFFTDPTAAFTRMRQAIRPGGRLSFVCWRSAEHNPWLTVPLRAIAAHVPVTPSEPDAPGPLAFGDGARVRSILAGAGFVDVALEARGEPMRIGGHTTVDDVTDFMRQIGPAARALREASPEAAAAATAALREAIAQHAGPDGVTLSGGVWLVTARAP